MRRRARLAPAHRSSRTAHRDAPRASAAVPIHLSRQPRPRAAVVMDEVDERARAARLRPYPENASRGLALDPVAFAIDIERWGFFDASRSEQVRPTLPI